MFKTLLQKNDKEAQKSTASHFLLSKSYQYLQPLQVKLDSLIDSRLVETFFNVFIVILMFRNSKMGLLLSELGGYICGHGHAPAGTKRISRIGGPKLIAM